MKINEQIKNQRKFTGMSIEDLARKSGISVSQCIDVEMYEDEFSSTLTSRDALNLCQALNLNIADLLGLEKKPTESAEKTILIRGSLATIGISDESLADYLGFDKCIVDEMKVNEHFFGGWPLDLIIKTADYLKINPLNLIY